MSRKLTQQHETEALFKELRDRNGDQIRCGGTVPHNMLHSNVIQENKKARIPKKFAIGTAIKFAALAQPLTCHSSHRAAPECYCSDGQVSMSHSAIGARTGGSPNIRCHAYLHANETGSSEG